ncbi:DUF3486 family protein [Methylolobus aquaticus]|nr:DUF3486 family protein [Methylolobus aquaticus]
MDSTARGRVPIPPASPEGRRVMPPRPRVFSLPPKIQHELNNRLRATGYGQLREHSAWLASLGHSIGKSALGKTAERLRDEDAKYGVRAAAIVGKHTRKERPKPTPSTPVSEAQTAASPARDTGHGFAAGRSGDGVRENQIQVIGRMLLARQTVSNTTVFPLGIQRLSELIRRLRCRGWPIRTEQKGRARTADYSLPPGWQPPDAEKPR